MARTRGGLAGSAWTARSTTWLSVSALLGWISDVSDMAFPPFRSGLGLWPHRLGWRGSQWRTLTIRLLGLVLLGTRIGSNFQYLDAWVNSDPTSCPFRNRPCAPVFDKGWAKI